MKRSLVKRLSGAIAAAAVALVGSLSALPQAHAATTYQLNQVGGSVTIQQVTFVGETTPVPGQFSNGFTVTGEKRSWVNQYTFKVGFSLGDLSKLQSGDKVVIPVTSPSPMLRPDVVPFTGTVGNQSVGPAFNVTGTGQSITFTATNNAASYSSVSGDMTFVIGCHNLGTQGTQEEWRIDVGNDYYTIYHLPMINANDGLAIGTSNYTYIHPSYTTKPLPNLDFRLSGLANAAIDGTLSTKFPEAVNGDIWQYAVITPLTRPVVVSVNENATNAQQLAYDGVHFAGQDGGLLGRHIVFTKKTVKAADLAKPEDTLKVLSPGEYALFDNGDGTWTYAVNWGKWQGNERTAIPNPIPSDITDTALKAKLNEYRGKGHGVTGIRSRVQLEFQGVTNNSTQMYKVDLVNGIGTKKQATYTKTASNNNGDVSGDGNLVDATVFYAANGATSGSAPANVTSSIGSKVVIASKGSLARTGHTFAGWNTKADGTGTKYTENQQVTLGQNGLRLYAQWAANTYTVTFNGNGATGGKTAAVSGKYDTKGTMTANGYTRTGYEFTGWNTRADGTGAAYTDKAAFTFKGNVTVYAQWKALADTVPVTPGFEDKPGQDPNKPAGYVTVTFAKGAHGTLSGTSAFHVNPAKAVTLKAPVVKASTGWKFSKWDKAFANTKFAKDTVVTALYVVVDQCAAVDVSKQERVYRLYNPVTSEHLFTTDANEYKVLAAKHGWKQERVAWVGPNSQGSSVGVYRLYNAKLGDHHYTKDKNEAKTLVAKHGWVYDNGGKPLFYSEDNASCSRVPVYRQYNPGLKTGQHHYTADANERETLVKRHGWKDEQIGWYAVSWK